jgi:hypothetical protein
LARLVQLTNRTKKVDDDDEKGQPSQSKFRKLKRLRANQNVWVICT